MTKTNENPLLKQALSYYHLGWSVIPIPHKSKKAIIQWKNYQQTSPDEGKMVHWFGNAQVNMAVVLGKVSGGLTCRDFDEMDSYIQWAKTYLDLAKTLPTVKTSRGMHVYFLSDFDKIKKFDDGELRGNGYCILPPSLHPSGIQYEWLIHPKSENLIKLNPEKSGFCNVVFTEETEDKEEIEDIEAISKKSYNVVTFEQLCSKTQIFVDEAITATLPDKQGYRNFLIFQYCRWLKGNKEFAKCKARQLKLLVRRWHERALPFIGTKPFDETWADFAYGWQKVKYPKGENMLKKAVETALAAKNKLNVETNYDTEEVQLLIRICYELQLLQGEEPFFLSCRSAGKILGLSHTQANKYLQMIEADGIIHLIKKNTTEYATRYKFMAN